MAGGTHYLRGKVVTLPNGTVMPVYYFNRRPKRDETVPALPTGYEIAEKAANGLPYLRRMAHAAVGTTGTVAPVRTPGAGTAR